MTISNSLWTNDYWKAVAERAIRTFAQSAAGIIAANATGLVAVDWAGLLSVAGAAALLSVLTSIAANNGQAGPSFTRAEGLVADVLKSQSQAINPDDRGPLPS